MFPKGYFTPYYFAETYFPPVDSAVPPVDDSQIPQLIRFVNIGSMGMR